MWKLTNLKEALKPNLRNENDGLPQYTTHAHQPYATYEIHLHPTYRIPTLWFTLHDLPMGEPAFDLDSVYRYLVPAEYRSGLRAAGVSGGISAAVSYLDYDLFVSTNCRISLTQ